MFACLLAALLSVPAFAWAQDTSASVAFTILNPPVILTNGETISLDVTYTPIEECSGCKSADALTLTGSGNIIEANAGTTNGLIGLTDNTGGNTLYPAGNEIVLKSAGTMWQTETVNLTWALTQAGCLQANGCNPSSSLQLVGTSEADLQVDIGGVWTTLIQYNNATGITLSGILAAGTGAILP